MGYKSEGYEEEIVEEVMAVGDPSSAEQTRRKTMKLCEKIGKLDVHPHTLWQLMAVQWFVLKRCRTCSGVPRAILYFHFSSWNPTLEML